MSREENKKFVHSFQISLLTSEDPQAILTSWHHFGDDSIQKLWGLGNHLFL